MIRFEKRFFKAIYRNHGGFIPTWPLGKIVELGDIISIKRGRMDWKGNITEQRIGIKVQEQIDTTPDDTKWQSKSSVSIEAKLAGVNPSPDSLIPIDKAGLTLSFKRKGGFLYQPKGTRYNRIANMIQVRNEAVKALTSNMFNFETIYLVKQVAMVDSYSLIISQSQSSKYEVVADGTAKLSTEDLADISLNLTVVKDEQLDYNVAGAAGGALFYKAEKLTLKPGALDLLLDHQKQFNPQIAAQGQFFFDLGVEKIDTDISELFHFVPMNLDDLEELMGNNDEYYED